MYRAKEVGGAVRAQAGDRGGGRSGARRGMEGGGFHCRCIGKGDGTGAGAIFQPSARREPTSGRGGGVVTFFS